MDFCRFSMLRIQHVGRRSNADSLDELHLSQQLDHVQAPESRSVLSFVNVKTDVGAHSNQRSYCLILTLHPAMGVPRHGVQLHPLHHNAHSNMKNL